MTWLAVDVPTAREDSALPVANGEPCYAVMWYVPPKRSKWRPRVVDAIPPMDVGKFCIFFPRRNLQTVLADVRSHNEEILAGLQRKPGRRLRCWAIAVSMIAGFDETAKPVYLLKGGAA